MRTLITQGHTFEVVARHIPQNVATAVCTVLAAVEHIRVTADVAYDGTVNLRPQCALTTPQEVVVLRAFASVSDVRLRLHEAVA